MDNGRSRGRGYSLGVGPAMNFAGRRMWGPAPNYPKVLAHKAEEPRTFYTIVGPCSIESPDQIRTIADALSKVVPPITYMRGGVFRAGTYPPKQDFGLQVELLAEWKHQADLHGLKIIVEVVDLRDLEFLEQFADALQIGARQMQNYGLLDATKEFDGHVTLKRNMGAKLDEWLGAAEYLLGGFARPLLIERGGTTGLDHVRWDLSISIIPAVHALTQLPVLIDASHGTGRRDLVVPMTLAGVAAGADGFMVEVHPKPCESLSDSDQAYPLCQFQKLVQKAESVRKALSNYEEGSVQKDPFWV